MVCKNECERFLTPDDGGVDAGLDEQHGTSFGEYGGTAAGERWGYVSSGKTGIRRPTVGNTL